MADLVLATADTRLLEIFEAETNAIEHTLHWACDGFEAIELVLRLQPFVLFLDSPLEVFSAFETAQKLREDPEVDAHLPIIYVSDAPEASQHLDAVGITTDFPRTHAFEELQDLLAKYQEMLWDNNAF